MEGEIGRAHDQDALGEAAKLKLAEQQAGHDGLAGASVVGEQEADAGEFQQVVVNGFELMRQRIDAGDRKAEVGIELVGDTEGVSLKPEAQQVAIAGVGACRALDLKLLEVGGGQGDAAEAIGIDADESDLPSPGVNRIDPFDSHRLVEQPPGKRASTRLRYGRSAYK